MFRWLLRLVQFVVPVLLTYLVVDAIILFYFPPCYLRCIYCQEQINWANVLTALSLTWTPTTNLTLSAFTEWDMEMICTEVNNYSSFLVGKSLVCWTLGVPICYKPESSSSLTFSFPRNRTLEGYIDVHVPEKVEKVKKEKNSMPADWKHESTCLHNYCLTL